MTVPGRPQAPPRPDLGSRPAEAGGAEALALPPLVDSHCHLTWDSLRGDLPEVVARARAAGVEQMVVVATDADTATAALEASRAHAGLYPTSGMHPNDLPPPEAWEGAFARVEAQLRSGAFVGVGETGLDYYRDAVTPALQRRSFLAHATLARSLDLPVIVHIRDRDGRFQAYDDVAEVLREVPGVRGVIHCFTGDPAHARTYLELGLSISFSGIVTFPKGENVREAARAVPLDRMLVETDAPFLAPIPHRGARNEPAFVADTARRLAEVKSVSEAEVRRATTSNARALFRLPDRVDAGPAPTSPGG